MNCWDARAQDLFMTKEKEPTIGKFKGTQPFVTGIVSAGDDRPAGFYLGNKIGPRHMPILQL